MLCYSKGEGLAAEVKLSSAMAAGGRNKVDLSLARARTIRCLGLMCCVLLLKGAMRSGRTLAMELEQQVASPNHPLTHALFHVLDCPGLTCVSRHQVQDPEGYIHESALGGQIKMVELHGVSCPCMLCVRYEMSGAEISAVVLGD